MSSPEENPEVKAIQLHLASAKNQVSIATEHADWAHIHGPREPQCEEVSRWPIP